jgi:hypothetical protein
MTLPALEWQQKLPTPRMGGVARHRYLCFVHWSFLCGLTDVAVADLAVQVGPVVGRLKNTSPEDWDAQEVAELVLVDR